MKKNFYLNSSSLYANPSFRKGMARLASIFGKTDQYNYKENADEEATRRDWAIVGKDISDSIEKYECKNGNTRKEREESTNK